MKFTDVLRIKRLRDVFNKLAFVEISAIFLRSRPSDIRTTPYMVTFLKSFVDAVPVTTL